MERRWIIYMKDDEPWTCWDGEILKSSKIHLSLTLLPPNRWSQSLVLQLSLEQHEMRFKSEILKDFKRFGVPIFRFRLHIFQRKTWKHDSRTSSLSNSWRFKPQKARCSWARLLFSAFPAFPMCRPTLVWKRQQKYVFPPKTNLNLFKETTHLIATFPWVLGSCLAVLSPPLYVCFFKKAAAQTHGVCLLSAIDFCTGRVIGNAQACLGLKGFSSVWPHWASWTLAGSKKAVFCPHFGAPRGVAIGEGTLPLGKTTVWGSCHRSELETQFLGQIMTRLKFKSPEDLST